MRGAKIVILVALFLIISGAYVTKVYHGIFLNGVMPFVSPVSFRNYSVIKKVITRASNESGRSYFPIINVKYQVPSPDTVNYYQHLGGDTLGKLSFACSWRTTPTSEPFSILTLYFDTKASVAQLGKDESVSKFSAGVAYCLTRTIVQLPQDPVQSEKLIRGTFDLVKDAPIVSLK